MSVGNNIYYRGVKNGRRVRMKIAYKPTLYLPTKKETQFKTLHNESLEPMVFDGIREARDFVKRYDDVGNFKIYGNSRFEYAFIADQQKGMVDWDQDHVSIAVIDIETYSAEGFPDPYKAEHPITAICIKYINGETIVYGCGDYNNTRGDVRYVKCADEYSLCKQFLEDWAANCPDVLSGWNIKFFDIPYLVNRFTKILGEDAAKDLSPWRMIRERKVHVMNRESIAYELYGVATYDYIELYKLLAPGGKSQESYRLDNIANVEIGERKLSYDEFDGLHDLYIRDYQKFIDYNIKDVELIIMLEDKLKLIELGLTLAYDTKTNYEDIFAQTRMWDSLIYNELLSKNIIVPPSVISQKDSAFEGAYVKDVQVGLHNWVASFDLDSLHPHLMMQFNMSPETVIDVADYTSEMRNIISQGVSVEKLLNKQIDTSSLDGLNVSITPTGNFFRTDKQGFLPAMLETMYADRKRYKRMMLDAKQELENETDSSKRREIEKRIARCNNIQLAKKLSLNSCFGATGSRYFRFYDLRIAESVTVSSQLAIRWIANKINGYMNNLLDTNSDYIIASDTDSVYVRLGELVEKVYGVDGVVKMPKQKVIDFMDKVCDDKIQPLIHNSYTELAEYVHAYAQKMNMKREALADKGIWTAKKRYILNVYNNEGVQYAEPDLKIMGLEVIKSSTPLTVRGRMKETIALMINGTESDVQEYIKKFKDEFKSLPPEEVSFPRGCNGLKEYADPVMLYRKGTPIQVKGAILYNHYLKKHNLDKKYPLIKEGEKLKYTYLKQPNPFRDIVVSYPGRLPEEFGLSSYIDYDTQFEKTYLDPVKGILKCIGWNHEKVNSLNGFFA